MYLSINIMPEPLKSYMGLGYLICRAMDTVVDTVGMPVAEKIELLQLMRGIDTEGNPAKIEAQFKRLAVFTSNPEEKELLSKFGKIAELYKLVPQKEKPLFKMLFSGIAEGMEIDAKTFDGKNLSSLKTTADLEKYCHLIGGVPGIFWAGLYREYMLSKKPLERELPTDEDGERIGCALQITNILKDMATDIKNGRCYIPAEELFYSGISLSELSDINTYQKLKPLIVKWQKWGIERLDSCERFLYTIPKREFAMRAAVIWPVYWSADSLEAVAHANVLNILEKPKISRSRIYSTIISTPPLLLSNMAFSRKYRFRRETLMLSLTQQDTID